jgi:hypothetical protein
VLVDPLIAGGNRHSRDHLEFQRAIERSITAGKQHGYDQRVEVFGSEEWQPRPTWQMRMCTAMLKGILGEPLYFFLERYMDSFIAEMKELLKPLTRQTYPVQVDGKTGSDRNGVKNLTETDRSNYLKLIIQY